MNYNVIFFDFKIKKCKLHIPKPNVTKKIPLLIAILSISLSYSQTCTTITAPYSQNFDAFMNLSDIDANCWSINGDLTWKALNYSSPSTGTGPDTFNGRYLFVEASSPAQEGHFSNLVSPSIDLSPLTNPSLRYDYHMYGADMGSLEVIITQGGIETTVSTLTGQQQASGSDPFLTHIIDLSAYANQTVQITFKAIRGSSYLSDIAMDSVFVDELCIIPSSLTTTNITATSVDLGWTAGQTETLWNVEWGAAGFTQGTGTTAAVTTNSHSLTGLTPSTSYEFYVQANCGFGNISQWVGPFSVTTPCITLNAPYSQNFEFGSNFDEDCWSIVNDIGDYNWQIGVGPTGSSNTGPSMASEGERYIYMQKQAAQQSWEMLVV